jgi:hypothetical protein
VAGSADTFACLGPAAASEPDATLVVALRLPPDEEPRDAGFDGSVVALVALAAGVLAFAEAVAFVGAALPGAALVGVAFAGVALRGVAFSWVAFAGFVVASPVTGATFAAALAAVRFAAVRDEVLAFVVEVAAFVVALPAAPRVAAFADVDLLVEDVVEGPLVGSVSASMAARRAASAARVAAGSGSNVRAPGPGVAEEG